MIIFTHSYNKHLSMIRAKKEIEINTIYINKIHTIGKNAKKVIQKYEDVQMQIIYDSPIYLFDFMTEMENKEILKRNLLGEILDGSKILDYYLKKDLFIKELKNCWQNYLLNTKDKNFARVLSIPILVNMKDDYWDEMLKIVNFSSNYKFISFAIHFSQIDHNLEKIFLKIKKFGEKLKIKKYLFTIKTDIETFCLPLEMVNIIETNLKKLGDSEIILHHIDYLIPQLKNNYSFCFGIDNQTKFLHSQQLPYIKNNNFARRSTSFFISEISSTINYKRMRNRLIQLGAESPKQLSILQKYVLKEEVDNTQEILINYREFKKISSMTYEKKKKTYRNAFELFDKVGKTIIKDIIYKLDGRKYYSLIK